MICINVPIALIQHDGAEKALPFSMAGAMNQLMRRHMRIVFQVGIVLGALLTSSLGVPADDVPALDVQPICRGIASQAANPTEKGGSDLTFSECVKSEQTIRDQISKVWSAFSSADKGHCVRLATQGGEPSYTELITCLEMARDVRKLRSTDHTKGIN